MSQGNTRCAFSRKKKLCSLSMLSQPILLYLPSESGREGKLDDLIFWCATTCCSFTQSHHSSKTNRSPACSSLERKLSVSVRFADLNLSRALHLSYCPTMHHGIEQIFPAFLYVGQPIGTGFLRGVQCNSALFVARLFVVYYRDHDGMGTMLRHNWSAFCQRSFRN